VPSYFELGQIEKIIITANNERLDMGQVPQRAAELPIEQYATLQGIQWLLHLGQARGLPLAPPNGKAQALCEPLVWRSAQANTKPNPIKVTEIQVATMMVSIGIVRSSECGRIIWQFTRREFDRGQTLYVERKISCDELAEEQDAQSRPK
jgi:hypothetical protein